MFPEDFHRPIRSVAVYCQDGIVLARYMADEDSFDFRLAPDETIVEAGSRIGAGTLSYDAPKARRWFLEFRNIKMMVLPDGGEEVLVYTPNWTSFSAGKGFSPRLWSAERARERAKWDVLAYVAAPVLGIDLREPGTDLSSPVKQTLAAYEAIVNEFRSLIETADREAPLQEFLARTPALLSLEAANPWPQFRLGDDYITDFVLELGNEEYVLVEIEAASRQLYTRGGNPSSDLTHAIQQVEDWRQWIESASPYIQTKLPGIAEPECWVVIGRRITEKHLATKWKRKQRQHLAGGVRLMTYDDLLDRNLRQLESLRRLEQD